VRWLALLRPSERVLAAFVAYAVVRLALTDHPRLDVTALPPFDLILGFGVVLVVRLFAQYRRVPWPESARGPRLMHLIVLGVFALLVVACVAGSPTFQPRPGTGGGVATETVLALHAWLGAVLLLVVPFAMFWLASAQHIKAHGRLDTVGMIRLHGAGAFSVLREWLPLLCLIYAYSLMGPLIGRGLFGDMDAPLARIDRALFLGSDPRVLLQPWISVPLSTWLSGCYVLYLPLVPVVVGLVFARRDLSGFRELAFALTLTFATGYILYTVVPAVGPLFLDRFDVPLDGYYGDWIKRDFMDRARIPRDCFPSLHTAISWVLLWGAFRHVRPLFWVILPVVASIPVACVYLRYHYVVDVLAGFALSFGVVAVTSRSRRLQSAFSS
jgi:membrane-associated phospholipid phosphatase